MAGPSQYRSGKHLDADNIVGASLAHAFGARDCSKSQGHGRVFAFHVNGRLFRRSDVS